MPRGRISPHISPARCVLLHTEVLDVAGTVGAVLTGVATDRLFGGCALRVAMHSCCATGACFLALMLACLCDMPWATHVAAIASIGFFIAGPGGVLGARSGGRYGEIWAGRRPRCEIWGGMGGDMGRDMGRYGEMGRSEHMLARFDSARLSDGHPRPRCIRARAGRLRRPVRRQAARRGGRGGS